ncbi:MAG: hypothetical protein J5620_00410 [Alphaproteobacteria bacterium]|nr:hypothetical protein [Alphaproteobacteria bacterium]
MRISILSIGAIASVLALNAYATSSTVTSRDYVDAQDALKQNTIPEAWVNYEENGVGETVVTYTDEAGVLGERGICDADADGDGDCNDNFLVTRDLLQSATNLPETTVTYKTCVEWNSEIHVDSSCILWELAEKRVIGQSCNSARDCPSGYCCSGNNGVCFNGPGCMM